MNTANLLAEPRALNDGDIITDQALAALHNTPVPARRPQRSAPAAAPDVPPTALARPSRADPRVRAQARAWLAANADRFQPQDPGEGALLHAVETSALVRPPIPARAAGLDAELAELYLMLARHWIATTTASGDPRYLNAALKLTAVSVLTGRAEPRLAEAALHDALDAVAALSIPPGAPPAPKQPAPHPAALDHRARIAVLAGEGSKGLALFRTAADDADVPLAGILLHRGEPDATAADSCYAQAWYPPPRTRTAAARGAPHPVPARTRPTAVIAHRDWYAAAEQLRRWNTDLIVLLGMDVVPEAVLHAARLGAINAHNGALPAYRGMDAVAWALLAGASPTCTIHLAVADVDAGDILAERPVPADSPDLRQAMKNTQIELLITVCAHLAATGTLPAARAQTGTPRRHYRMHPALRRVLDQTAPPSLSPEGAAR